MVVLVVEEKGVGEEGGGNCKWRNYVVFSHNINFEVLPE